MNKTKVIFCLPGRTFSDNFLKSWTDLLVELPKHNIQWDFHKNTTLTDTLFAMPALEEAL